MISSQILKVKIIVDVYRCFMFHWITSPLGPWSEVQHLPPITAVPMGKINLFDNGISHDNFHEHPLVKSKDGLLYVSPT